MDNLPYEIVENIISYINIGYVAIAISILGQGLLQSEKRKLLNNRNNPLRYLSQLVSSPLSLISVMRRTKAILGGSRAAGYFNPQLVTSGSDWDFYCPHIRNNVVVLVSYFERQGFIFDTATLTPDAYGSTPISVISGKKEDKKIQIIATTHSTTLHAIISYGCSLTQCLISGYCAISLYHLLLKDNKGLVWERNIIHNLSLEKKIEPDDIEDNSVLLLTHMLNTHITKSEQIESCLRTEEAYINKYRNRGLDIVDYIEYQKYFDKLPICSIEDYIVRSVYDSISFIVDFKFTTIENIPWQDYIYNIKWLQDDLSSKYIPTSLNSHRQPLNTNYYRKSMIADECVPDKTDEYIEWMDLSKELYQWISTNIGTKIYRYKGMYPF